MLHTQTSPEYLEQLRSGIQASAIEDFSSLPRASFDTATARFYWYPDKKEPDVLIKVFTGGTAGWLYRQEIMALYSLRATGRVCNVLCDSTRSHPKFWDDNFQGPYFIAKPYYRNSLKSTLGATTAFEKLDIAAQQIDIARVFLKAGWRDFDWRTENDVVDSDGRILRIDLDSASALSFILGEKSTLGDKRYFSITENEKLEGFLELREEILRSSQVNEVRNLALRFTFQIFIDENYHNDLIRLIVQIQASGGTEAGLDGSQGSHSEGQAESPPQKNPALTQRANGIGIWLMHIAAHILKSNPAGGVGKAEPQSTPSPTANDDPQLLLANTHAASGGRINLLNEWVNLWLQQAPARSSSQGGSLLPLSQLESDEWKVLARFFYYLISNPDHGFSLDDYYGSIVILIFSFLRARKHRIASASQPEDVLIRQFAPNTRLFEVQRLSLDTVTKKEKKTKKTKPVPTPAIASPPILNVEFMPGSGHWAATKKSGHQCEDRSFIYSGGTVLIAAVIDGVSNASGREAAEIVVKELDEWSKNLKIASQKDAEGHILEVIRKINSGLITASKETKRPHQAALVLAVVSKQGESYFVSIAQAGDSNCVVFSPDMSLVAGTKHWITAMLGTVERLDDENVMIEHNSLGITGPSSKYGIRLFSDGIGDHGYERIREVSNITELVSEAANWPITLNGAVGHDDWSIAGFDISIEEIPVMGEAPSKEEAIEEKEDYSLHNEFALLAAIDRFDQNQLNLSDRAKKFWSEFVTLSGDSKTAGSLSLVREVVGSPTPVLPPKIEHGQRPNKRRIIILFVSLFLLLIGGVVWYRSSSPSEKEKLEEQPSKRTTPPTPESPAGDPEFTSSEQKKIYLNLKEKNGFIGDGLPGGDGIDAPKIKKLLSDLAEVIGRAKYNIVIEVYSTPTGEPKTNKLYSDTRAERIRRYLSSDGRVLGSQFNVVGKGEWDGGAPDLNKELLQGIDTSKAIFVIRRI